MIAWFFEYLIGVSHPQLIAKVHSNLIIQGGAVFSFNNSDIAILAALCVANLFCAGIVHHAVLFNSGFMQRRLLFEGLSLFGFLAAIVLSLFSVLMWVRNPPFVIACTLLWVTLCLLVVVQIWRSNRNRLNKKVLEIPEFWDQRTIHSDQPVIMTGKNTEGSKATLTMLPEMAGNTSTRPMHRASVSDETETAAHSAQREMFGKDVRDKLEKYNKKRAYRSAPISNLSAYRQRSKKALTESSKTACK